MKTIIVIVMTAWSLVPIVIRHDKNDKDYQNLSQKFEKNICHLNLGEGIPDGEGTVIDSNWVLTAAHCAIEIEKKLGKNQSHKVTILGKNHLIDKVVIHKSWADNEAYDIALLHLMNPTRNAEPVAIYNGDDELGKLVYIVGLGDFGNGLEGVKGNDGTLRAATNKVDEATDFWLKWRFDNPETNPINTTEYEGISGPGDSGGPAFMEIKNTLYVVGVSSAQSTRNTNGQEGVYGVLEYYTRVSRYVNWINENMN